MQSIVIIILIGLAGGIAVGVQAPLSSMINQRLGPLESIFMVHLGGTLASLIPLLIYGGGKLGNWRSVPWYALGAGTLGLVVIFSMNYMIPRVGVATALIILLSGQLLTGSVMDHFGLLGTVQRPIDFMRVIGLAVVFLGVWLSVK
jgi:bacterial/archaeal transporter family-2 protein